MHTDDPADSPVSVELLAPARNAAIAFAAINHGADAVYMGASGHGARKQAANSIEDVRYVVEYAHRFGVKVYVTVNTIVYEDEIKQVEFLIRELWRIGVDAIIVQDMGILRMDIPPIPLHASTQCDIRTPEKARFLENAGFSQLVLPRELSLDEIRLFRKATTVPLEAFVHGALCVSYSGDCQASFALKARSANRGECAQICRYKYDLENEKGEKIIRDKFLLSLKDMNRIGNLSEMLDAGITSFKIEGRLKDEGYVKNVVAAYSNALDMAIKASGGRFMRASKGRSRPAFVPDVNKSFNRGFTSYFLHLPLPESASLASADTPKWVGEEVGTVVGQTTARRLKVRLRMPLNNGDGIGCFNRIGEYKGCRVNRVDGDELYVASDFLVPPGTKIYRNSDRNWDKALEKSDGNRKIPVSMLLRGNGSRIILEITDEDGVSVVEACDYEEQPAKTPQEDARRRVLSKLGDTDFELVELCDLLRDRFVPSSMLASLRRSATEALGHVYAARYPTEFRRLSSGSGEIDFYKKGLSRHDNISNSLARGFYAALPNVNVPLPDAIEVSPKSLRTDARVMQTRYCIRRELGACLKTKAAGNLPKVLYLASGAARFRLEFDCSVCCMNVYLCNP